MGLWSLQNTSCTCAQNASEKHRKPPAMRPWASLTVPAALSTAPRVRRPTRLNPAEKAHWCTAWYGFFSRDARRMTAKWAPK